MSLLTTAQDTLGRATRPPRPACPAVGLLSVLAFAPAHGDHRTPISVAFACAPDIPSGVHVRLVVGRRAVATHVRAVDPPGCGHWQLLGHAPSFAKQKSSSPAVPLTIQAVDKLGRVVDSVTFAHFVYHPPGPPAPPRRPSLRIPPGGDALDRPSKRRSPYSQPQTPSSSDSEHGSPSSSCPRPQPATPTLRRASRQMEPDNSARTVVLDITTSLDSFCYDWDESELSAGRRLVRFRRIQDGNKLIISAERISQADYDPDDIVISCIYRQETDSCCVTSVDIIHLLQRLVEADFEVDEKNRIRRNLEGLRPTTVSKTRPGFESFFQRIMDFPDPKPRKIEKDVKVFDWKLLPHALDKILSKYSLCTRPSAPSPPADKGSCPPFGATMPPVVSPDPSPGGAMYGDDASRLPLQPHTDALYLSHVSPAVQLTQFPSECSPDSSPELHRRSSLPEDQLQSIYLDTEIMRRYFPVEPDLIYGAPPSSGPFQAPVSTDAPPAMLAHDTTFVGDQPPLDWSTQPPSDVLFLPSQGPMYASAYGYNQSDSAESIDISPLLPYPISAYDSFEFPSLQDQLLSVPSPSQHT